MGVGRKRTKDKHLPRGVYYHHGAYWYFWYEAQDDGKRKQRTRRLASEYPDALTVLSKILDGAAAPETFAALVSRYETERLPEKSKNSQNNEKYILPVLTRVFGVMSPGDIEPHHIWTHWRKSGQTSTARHEIRVMSAVMNFARQIGAVHKDARNPCHELGLPSEDPRDRYVTDEEFLAVRAFAPTMVGYAMDLAFMCGMDRSTILALERRHLTDRGIEFQRSKTSRPRPASSADTPPKKKRPGPRLQVSEWTPELREVVNAILAERPRLRAALICTEGGQHYTGSGFATLWQRTMEKAVKQGVDRFTFHDLRAKSASDAGSDQEAADRLGHSDPRVTRRVYRRLPRVAPALKLPERGN